MADLQSDKINGEEQGAADDSYVIIEKIMNIENKLIDESLLEADRIELYKSLLESFNELRMVKNGPLNYFNIATLGAIQRLYGLDMQKDFDGFETQSQLLGGKEPPVSGRGLRASNWAPTRRSRRQKLHIVQIKDTEKNGESAKMLLDKLIRSIKEKIAQQAIY